MFTLEILQDYVAEPLLLVVVLVGGLIGLNMLLTRLQKDHPERAIQRQLAMLLMSLVALLLLIALLPISEGLRGQILSLLGILLSAGIALSATTFLGNALAGILLRSVRSFRSGDFVYIQNQFGRVSGRGLFHIEIQTEDRDLLTLPNLYVTNHPVKVTRASGTIISTEVSLGYDVPHSQVESLLLQAASDAGLEDPFVYILKLGDFSILYRANGLLTEVKQLLSARSRLNSAILDVLHQAGVEIVSPNFMNTRDVSGQTFAAKTLIKTAPTAEGHLPEEVIFDKAEQAATLEEQQASLAQIEKRLEALKEESAKADDNHQARVDAATSRLQQQQDLLQSKIAAAEKRIENGKD
jgi:small-conductance mechanosensitive channel